MFQIESNSVGSRRKVENILIKYGKNIYDC